MASNKCPLPPPPRTLNVLKFAESRAPELDSLHAAISARVNQDFRITNSKRRRTTGHRASKGRRRKRQKIGDEPAKSDSGEKAPKKMCRRVRRSLELRANPECGFLSSGDGTRRLRTHLWHAKRFTMTKQWGFHLPLGLHGRGRGSRAVLRWLKSGVLVHDASYCHPVQLEGSEASILAILRMVVLPSPSCTSDVIEDMPQAVLGGVSYEDGLLYHVGIPFSKFIGPVIYMWRPSLRDNNYSSDKQVPLSNGRNISGKNECSTSYRQLLMWIHAAAFREGFDALRFACQKQMTESGTSVSCFSLEGYIAKLEILGTKATRILQEILHPVSESPAMCAQSVARTNSEVQKSLFLSHADQLPSHSILSLTVHDPRRLPSSETKLVARGASCGPEHDIQDEVLQDSNTLVSGVPVENGDFVLSMWSKPEVHGIFLSESKDLWDSSAKLKLPVPDNVICAEKHQRRLNYLNLANNGIQDTDPDDSFGQSCSVLLVKHFNQGSLDTRWSVILPLSWVKVFWLSFVSHGARAIGLRERRWISCNNGVPCFPFDFPDSKAYSSHMAEEAAAFDSQAERRPLAVRPIRVPIPPPWNCLSASTKKGSGIIRDPGTLDMQHPGKVNAEIFAENLATLSALEQAGGSEVNAEIFAENLATLSALEQAGGSKVNAEIFAENLATLSASEQAGGSFQGSILRTSRALHIYLEETHDTQQLLFPYPSMADKSLFEPTGCNKPNKIPNVDSLPTDREPSFVRVLLHAFKEGAFEAGAVICAPVATDIIQWASRSEKNGTLQIAQSFVGSYFTEEDSGNWKLQVPEDVCALQSFRWPVGFVTTGFVRGSVKPVAEAFCEVGLLSLLRGQQWSETQIRRNEIFVLVRNMRSTAYRRALATVVLEQQKEDLEFM